MLSILKSNFNNIKMNIHTVLFVPCPYYVTWKVSCCDINTSPSVSFYQENIVMPQYMVIMQGLSLSHHAAILSAGRGCGRRWTTDRSANTLQTVGMDCGDLAHQLLWASCSFLKVQICWFYSLLSVLSSGSPTLPFHVNNSLQLLPNSVSSFSCVLINFRIVWGHISQFS